MSPPPGFAERVFEARTASKRRLWFGGAALFTAAAAITTILMLRQQMPATLQVTGDQPAPVPTPTIAPPLVPVSPPAPAVAMPQRKIAILGIEALHHVDAQIATELTRALRERAKAGIGPYELGPGRDAELIDEKILNNCENEAPACMAAIGYDLGVDVLMFGKIELASGGYGVTLKLLDVKKKKVVRSLTRTIAFPDRSEDAETRLRNALDYAPDAKRMYSDLTGP